MARPLYSKRMFCAAGVTSVTYAGPVPTGKVWIVRDIDAYTSAGISSVIFFFSMTPAGGGAPAFFAGKVSAGSSDTVQWRGRQVIPAGEYIQINPNGATIDATISGYELDAP